MSVVPVELTDIRFQNVSWVRMLIEILERFVERKSAGLPEIFTAMNRVFKKIPSDLRIQSRILSKEKRWVFHTLYSTQSKRRVQEKTQARAACWCA